RRRFGGRHPVCGTGVRSRIAVTSRPAACNERIAASPPASWPFTATSRDFIPLSTADLAAVSAAILASNGVVLLDPLKSSPHAELKPITLPPVSVIVTIVLLKVE